MEMTEVGLKPGRRPRTPLPIGRTVGRPSESERAMTAPCIIQPINLPSVLPACEPACSLLLAPFMHLRSSWLLLLVLLVGCAEDADAPAELAKLDQSKLAWQSLEGEHGSTYWYEETACGAGVRDVTLVQVTAGTASLISRSSANAQTCEPGAPFRYASFDPTTLPDLIDQCRQHLARRDETSVDYDDDGVVASCRVAGEDGCSDACELGFNISRRNFGVYE